MELKGETNGWKERDEGECQSHADEGVRRQSLNLQKEAVDVSSPSGRGRLVGMVLAIMLGMVGLEVDMGGVWVVGENCVVA